FFPFNYSDVADFDDVFDELVKKNINNAYDDAWAEVFLPFMKRFEQRAAEAEAAHEPENASKIYLYALFSCSNEESRILTTIVRRAASLGQISRCPILSTPLKREAWELQKKLYLKGASFWKEPVTNVIFPHTHAANGDGPEIQMFVRLPQQTTEASTAPCLLYLTGLDGYRTDTMPGAAARLVSEVWAVLAVEIPGTGDCPAAPNDPKSPDRLYSSVLDWIEAQPNLDHTRTVIWGTSTGGYYAIRVAHTHAERLLGVVAHGGCSHFVFSSEWLHMADAGEYAFKYRSPHISSDIGS
ncbi:MAG: hypothetical protein M1830_003633, partial [Pleopsidium flavum]